MEEIISEICRREKNLQDKLYKFKGSDTEKISLEGVLYELQDLKETCFKIQNLQMIEERENKDVRKEKQNKFTRTIELDYNELAFLFCKVQVLVKSKSSATEKSLWINISNKLQDAIADMDKRFKPATEFTPLNIHFFEDDELTKS